MRERLLPQVGAIRMDRSQIAHPTCRLPAALGSLRLMVSAHRWAAPQPIGVGRVPWAVSGPPPSEPVAVELQWGAAAGGAAAAAGRSKVLRLLLLLPQAAEAADATEAGEAVGSAEAADDSGDSENDSEEADGDVCCDGCDKWFKTSAAGLTVRAAAALDSWHCQDCRPAAGGRDPCMERRRAGGGVHDSSSDEEVDEEREEVDDDSVAALTGYNYADDEYGDDDVYVPRAPSSSEDEDTEESTLARVLEQTGGELQHCTTRARRPAAAQAPACARQPHALAPGPARPKKRRKTQADWDAEMAAVRGGETLLFSARPMPFCQRLMPLRAVLLQAVSARGSWLTGTNAQDDGEEYDDNDADQRRGRRGRRQPAAAGVAAGPAAPGADGASAVAEEIPVETPVVREELGLAGAGKTLPFSCGSAVFVAAKTPSFLAHF